MTELFPRVFETERLRFERIDPGTVDALDVYPYVSSEDGIEDATRYMTWEPHGHPKETFEFLRAVAAANDAATDGTYALYPKAGEPRAGAYAGHAGLHPDWENGTVTFGVWLRKPFWGRGYSGERADAFVELAFDRLDVELAAITVDDDNDRSKRAIEKYVNRWGGQHDGYFRNITVAGGTPRDSHRYTIARADYDAADVDVALTVVEE
ncbi:GNAT family protein [Halorubellus sp. PRR65]|uniref:GNAT family N-acetyltransferase n=1 Tax=Halorubellus sp. PRR65 TaxID=3098148 RepID=UPI002B25D54F|nr:GNAT family protein [Halorubellus sp. PRR65]